MRAAILGWLLVLSLLFGGAVQVTTTSEESVAAASEEPAEPDSYRAGGSQPGF